MGWMHDISDISNGRSGHDGEGRIHVGMTQARTKTTIQVSNVHESLTKDALYQHFIPFGEIVDVEDPITQPNGDRVTHIEYEDPTDAAAALDNMDGADLYGETITVAMAAPKTQTFEGLGSNVPLWEQEGFIQKYLVNGHQDDPMQGLETQQQQQQQQQQEDDASTMAQAELPVSVGPMPVK